MILASKTVWAVVGEDPNDGYPKTYAYFSREEWARSEAARLNGKCPTQCCGVTETTVWHESGTERYWLVRKEPISFDLPTRESVLAKLSDKELEVLGIKR